MNRNIRTNKNSRKLNLNIFMRNKKLWFIFSMQILLSICLFLSYPIPLLAQNKKNYDIDKWLEPYLRAKSIVFNVNYSFKSFDDTAFYIMTAKCGMIKDQLDKNFGGIFYYDFKNADCHIAKIYNEENIYFIDHLQRKRISFSVQKNEFIAIRNKIDGEIINVAFLNIEKLNRSC